jgi:molybdopterin-guanine dinucleotide biosynthesis protein A
LPSTRTPGRYALPGVRVLGDLFPDTGPVGGILTGLTALGPGRHLVVACDMPALNPAVLRLLREAATPDWDAVVPEIGGRLEPLCAAYRDSAAPPLRRFLETGQRAARRALETLRVRRIGEEALRRIDPDLACFTNLNTPEERENWLAQGERGQGTG